MRLSRRLALALSLSSLLISISRVQAGEEPSPLVQETKPQKDARMKWWREARFGLFIHWGIYSVPAGFWKGKPVDGIGEWNIGFWVDASDTVSWTAKITHPGVFRVEVVQACPDDTAGTEYTLNVGGQTLAGNVAATDGWQSYKTLPLGKIKIDQAGSLTIKIVPAKLKGLAVMNLRAVVLIPEKA